MTDTAHLIDVQSALIRSQIAELEHGLGVTEAWPVTRHLLAALDALERKA